MRVEPELKQSAEAVLKQIGLSTSEAVNMFLHQVVLNQGLPFMAKIPNAETVAALRDAENGHTIKFNGTPKDMLAFLDNLP